MLQTIVGAVDVPSAAVLISFFIGSAAILIALIARHKGRAEIELERMRVDGENKRVEYNAETQRVLEVKRLEQNLITSHRAT